MTRRRGSPCRKSIDLLAELERGYIVHNAKQWVPDPDPDKPKRLMQHRPDVRYVSPIAGHERRQFWRQQRKLEKQEK